MSNIIKNDNRSFYSDSFNSPRNSPPAVADSHLRDSQPSSSDSSIYSLSSSSLATEVDPGLTAEESSGNLDQIEVVDASQRKPPIGFIQKGANAAAKASENKVVHGATKAVTAAATVIGFFSTLFFPITPITKSILTFTGVYFVANAIKNKWGMGVSSRRIKTIPTTEKTKLAELQKLVLLKHKQLGASFNATIARRILDLIVDATVLGIGIAVVVGAVSLANGGIAIGVTGPIAIGVIAGYFIYSYKDRPLRLLAKVEDLKMKQQQVAILYLRAKGWLEEKGEKVFEGRVDSLENYFRVKAFETDTDIAERKKNIKESEETIAASDRQDFQNYVLKNEKKGEEVWEGKPFGKAEGGELLESHPKWRGFIQEKAARENLDKKFLENYLPHMAKELLNDPNREQVMQFLQVGMGITIDKEKLAVEELIEQPPEEQSKGQPKKEELTEEQKLVKELQNYFSSGKSRLQEKTAEIHKDEATKIYDISNKVRKIKDKDVDQLIENIQRVCTAFLAEQGKQIEEKGKLTPEQAKKLDEQIKNLDSNELPNKIAAICGVDKKLRKAIQKLL